MHDTSTDSKAPERRDGFRVSDQILLTYEPMGEREAALRRKTLQGTPSGAFAMASELHEMRQESALLRRRAEQESSVVARLIDLLDRKIERVAEVLMMHELDDYRLERRDVDLGADGMRFVASGQLPVGKMIDMRMILPSTGLGLRTFARVVHCSDGKDGEPSIGVRFEFLREHDRELMLHHILQRESVMLRDRHQLES